MNTSHLVFLLGAGGLLLSAPTLSANVERQVSRSFAVQPGGTLIIDAPCGGITVTPGTGTEVTVAVTEHIDAATEAEADALLQNYDLNLTQKDATVSAIGRCKAPKSMTRGGKTPPVRCDFVVTVPARFNVDLKTGGGDITVGDLTGRVSANTTGGKLSLGRITGPVKARTQGGNIVLASGTGSINAHAAGASIDITLAGPLHGDSDLTAAGGDITLRVADGAQMRIEAQAASGRVDCQLGGGDKGGFKRERFAASINGGGPTVSLRSSGGDIAIVPL